jgi:K+ transporter
MPMLAASSNVTAGAWMTLVIPVALVVVMIAWGWMLRRRAE